MRRLWNKWTFKQRLLVVLFILFPVLMILRYADIVPRDQLPLPQTIRQQEAMLRAKRKSLKKLQVEEAQRQQEFVRLQEQAKPLWQVQGKTPAVEVVAEFNKLVRQAQVKPKTVGKPRSNKYLDFSEIREVDFPVQLTASMKEVSRMLAQLDGARQVFSWSSCSIRPDNIRSPKTVRLTARIRALVLSGEASKFLSNSADDNG